MKHFKSLGNALNEISDAWAKRAPKKKSAIIGYAVLLELLVLIPELIISFPLIILIYCSLSNAYGMSIGDANSLQGNFYYLVAVTAIVTLTLIAIIQAIIISALKKAWGKTKTSTPNTTNETKENEEAITD